MLDQLIQKGIRTNLFVYDDEAKTGHFTPRLISLIHEACKSFLAEPDEANLFLVPEDSVTCAGPIAKPIPANAEHEYMIQGGCFLGNKSRLVVAICKSGKVVLGGF